MPKAKHLVAISGATGHVTDASEGIPTGLEPGDKHIVKVQFAIAGPTRQALIYAEGNLGMAHQSLDRKIRAQCDTVQGPFGAGLKAYFEAEWVKDTVGWRIGKKVDAQDW